MIASPLLERVFITSIAHKPVLAGEFTDITDLFSDALNMRAYEAIASIRSGSAEAVAEEITSKTQIQVETKDVQALYQYGDGDPVATYRRLVEIRNRRKQVEVYQKAIDDLTAGLGEANKIPSDTFSEALKWRTMDSTDILESDDWYGAACRYADHQRMMMDNNTLPTFPPEMGIAQEIDGITKSCTVELGTMLLFIGKTSSGKSIEANQFSDWLASRHGRWQLNVNTELMKRHVLWRRIVRLSAKRCYRNNDLKFSEAIKYEQLENGYKNETLFRELLKIEGGGRIIDWDAGNMTVADIVTVAKRYGHNNKGVMEYPDLWIDYWDMINFRGVTKLTGSNDSAAIGASLTTLKAYAQEYGTIVGVVQQTDKAAHLTETVSAENAKDSITFVQRANWAESINAEVYKQGALIQHPLTKEIVNVEPGQPSPIASRTIDKDTFHGMVKKKLTCYRDRWFWMYRCKHPEIQALADVEFE